MLSLMQAWTQIYEHVNSISLRQNNIGKHTRDKFIYQTIVKNTSRCDNPVRELFREFH